jgi:hypothetical protein
MQIMRDADAKGRRRKKGRGSETCETWEFLEGGVVEK